MGITYKLTVGQVDGQGDFAPDSTLGGTINLRLSPYSVAAYTGSLDGAGTGRYAFTNVESGDYKVYNSGSELTAFGIIRIGQSDAVLTSGAQTVADIKTFSGQPIFNAGMKVGALTELAPDTGIVVDGITLKDSLTVSGIASLSATQTIAGATTMSNLIVPAITGSSSVVNAGQGDARYIRKETGVTAQQIYSDIIFRVLPYLLDDPTHAKHAVNMLFVQNYCQAILSGLNPTAYQQSNNEIRVIPDGVQETNKVYRTIASALTAAEAFAASDRIMYITFQGNGIGSTLTDYNLLPAGSAEEYIHIVGIGEGINIRVAEDLYDGTLGQNIYSNLTFDNEAEDANTDFTNKTFYHCKFSNTFGSGTPSYDFVGCIFVGCTITTGYTFDSACKGDVYDLVNAEVIILGDINLNGGLLVDGYTVVNSSGDVKPRRLQGRHGTNVASATTITLGDGNSFNITGTTTIELMTNTDWDAGSIVTLAFTTSVTLEHSASPAGPTAAFFFKAGVNKNAVAGDMLHFMLDTNRNLWFEI